MSDTNGNPATKIDYQKFTPAEQACISKNISEKIKEGMPRDQAIAASISICAPEKSRKAQVKQYQFRVEFRPDPTNVWRTLLTEQDLQEAIRIAKIQHQRRNVPTRVMEIETFKIVWDSTQQMQARAKQTQTKQYQIITIGKDGKPIRVVRKIANFPGLPLSAYFEGTDGNVWLITLGGRPSNHGPVDKFIQMAKTGQIKAELLQASEQMQVRDPAAVCGAIWFDGTDAQRAGFGSGTEGRSRSERPPKAWWDD